MAESQVAELNNLQREGFSDEQNAQYLTFELADEDYGVDILRVQEIRGWDVVTRVPNTPSYVKGVLNLRGAIVPIFDLRERFDLSSQEYTKDTVVIVLRVNGDTGMRIMGIIVDAVSDVLNSNSSGLVNAPDFGGRVATEFIAGLVSAGEKMVMLLDVDKLLGQDQQSEQELAAVN
ncbi:MAG: chemotaxis protein CheW [Candidatus Polarisedimenticolaceae bacterium]|nr:chemotaxis protein CheW [Candidatus Polarisedimenticolaceae bacterium]